MVANPRLYPRSNAGVHCGLRKDAPIAPDLLPLGGVKNWADWLADREDEEMLQRIRTDSRTGRPWISDGFIS